LPEPPPLRRRAWIPAAAGGLFGATAAVLLLNAKAQSDALTGGDGPGGNPSTLSAEQALAYRTSGPRLQTLGLISAGATVAALATAGAMYWIGKPGDDLQTVVWM